MKFVSTRHSAPAVPFSDAILEGLAPDGGLYVPETWPEPDVDAFDPDQPFDELAARVLEPFFEGDWLAPQLGHLCRSAFDFDMPLTQLGQGTSILELFHGPTAAFKDFGARFLAVCFEGLVTRAELTILVATSGDTGAAVAAACHRRDGMRVAVLFPDGGVAPRQEHQLTCWDGNVQSFAVRGTFDDCQRVVKGAFRADDWPPSGRLSSANSINIGRLLPQASYYAIASLRYRKRFGAAPGFVIPSGNVGNAVAAFWAKRMGFPIREIVMASNANRVVPDWFETGRWRPRPSRKTLANAMDVGDPSNMERLFNLYPDRNELRRDASSVAVDDDTIRTTIKDVHRRHDVVVCPHTATAVHVRAGLDSPHWVVVATAHPAKFDSIVEPLIGRELEVPPHLAELLERPRRVSRLEPGVDALIAAMAG